MVRKIGAVILLLCLSILTGCRFDQNRRNAALSTVATALLDTIFRLERATPLTQSTSRPTASSNDETLAAADGEQLAQDKIPAPAGAEEPRDVPKLIAECRAAGSSIDVIADDIAADDESDEQAVEVPRNAVPSAVAPAAPSRRVSAKLAALPKLAIPELDEAKIAAIVATVSVHAGHKEASRVDRALREGMAQCRRVNEQIRVRVRERALAHKAIEIEVPLPPEASL